MDECDSYCIVNLTMKTFLQLTLTLVLLFLSIACLSFNLPVIAEPSPTPLPTDTPLPPAATATQKPPMAASPNAWCLYWSPNYCLSFDENLWELVLDADGLGELSNLSAPDCRITEQGPMGMPDDISKETIGAIEYTVVDRLYTQPSFVAFTALSNPDPQTENCPHFFVYVSMPDHFECQSMARQVLASLHLK